MKIWYRKGEVSQMELKAKLEEVQKEYDGLIRQIQSLDEQKTKLLGRGIALEGKIEILREQIADADKPVEVKASEDNG